MHGWGFHAGLWSPVLARLRAHAGGDALTLDVVDLGFLSGGPAGLGEGALPEGAVWVGHSLGVLWALERAPRPLQGLVSINGFDCFHAHVPPARLAAMRRGLMRDPVRQLRAFWQACGCAEPLAGAEALEVARLAQGLDWLARWDGREAHATLRASGCRVLALATRDDAIVEAAASAAMWPEESLVWCERGGHSAPLTQPEWCADAIAAFLLKGQSGG